MTTTRSRLLAFAIAVLVAIGGLIWATRPAGAGPALPTQPASQLSASQALSSAPTVDDATNPGRLLAQEQAQQEAAVLAGTTIPLPQGGNFNGIRWEDLPDPMPENSLINMLQHNAACQWYLALRDGRELESARQIARDLPNWSALRSTGDQDPAVQAARNFATGQGTDDHALQICRDTRQRQISYATAHGLIPMQ